MNRLLNVGVCVGVNLRRFLLRVLFMTMLLVDGANASNSGVFSPQEFTLDNGLRVIVVENHRVPAVSHFIWYKVGAMDEPRGKSGIAHFLEHLMFKATKDIPEGEFSRRINRLGGDLNAFTSWDFTAYYVKIARDSLPTIMQMEADRMRNIELTEEAVKTERDVIIAERKQVVESDVSRQFAEQMSAALYQNHPYGVPIIGWLHEMQQLSRQDALSFYQTYYAPNNAIVVISGDVTLAEVKAMAQKYYGHLKPSVLSDKANIHEPQHLAHVRVQMSDERVSMPSWERQYIAPSYFTAKDNQRQIDALQVLASLLVSGETGILHEALVHDSKLANSVSVSYDPQSRGPATFEISVIPANPVKPAFDKIEGVIDNVLNNIEKHITDADIKRIKVSMIADATFVRDGLFYSGMLVGQTASIGMPLDYLENWPDSINNITKEEIIAASKTLNLNNSVTGALIKK